MFRAHCRSPSAAILLRLRPTYALIHGVRVDTQALVSLAHRCDPSRCRMATSCCSSYEVLVDRKEQLRIRGHMNDAALYAIDLAEDEGFADPFEPTEGGTCLATNEDGLCVFAYRNSKRHLLCSLHSAAFDHGLPGTSIKPMACAIWPLYYIESDPPVITVQEGVAAFPCNEIRAGRRRNLDPGVAAIIQDVWGPAFLTAVERELRG